MLANVARPLGLDLMLLHLDNDHVALLLKKILHLVDGEVSFVVRLFVLDSRLLILLSKQIKLLVEDSLVLNNGHALLEVIEIFVHDVDLPVDQE